MISDPEYEDWYKNQREKKGFHSHQDDNVRGQRREAGGAPALTHPGGASPPDVIESSPEDFLEFYSDPEDFWTIPTTKGARKRRQRENPHYAAFPEAVCVAPILATTDPLDLVLDPFAGTGTVGVVAKKLGRRCILIELNERDCETAAWRVREVPMPFEAFGVNV